MNWIFLATAAQVILGSSAVFDKLLLKKRSIDPWPYTFWLGMFGALAAILLPFGFQAAGLQTIILALLAGAIFIAAFFFQFQALETSEASESLPMIGALAPVFTLFLASFFLASRPGFFDFLGFSFLVASGFIIFLAEKRAVRRSTLWAAAAASFLFAASTVASKVVFLGTSFLTGFFWIKAGGVLAALLMLALPRIRKRVLSASEHAAAHNKILYFANRGFAGLGSLAVSGAVFLASPALVEATQNLKYVVIFVLAAIFLRERFRGWVLAAKIAATLLIITGLLWLAAGEYVRNLPAVVADRPITWGLTFSQKFSRELGLNWQENYRAILDELRPASLRLIAYWDEIELEEGKFVLDDLDWQIREAEQRRIPYILALGVKTPRWPECHLPDWAASLPTKEQEAGLHQYLRAVVERYRNRPLLMLWQVENEPFLWFGQCPVPSKKSLEREVTLVRSFDQQHPILVTDGGEFGLWAPVARFGDIFGTTIYRKTYPRFIGPLFGVIEYPLDPEYFRVKERLVRWLNQKPDQRFIVVELQAEPWEPRSLASVPAAELVANFSPEYFRDTIEYAKATGFEEYYLWGAEWWWFMKEKRDDARYWEIARSIFLDK